MLWSQRSVLLVAMLSAVTFSTLIAARSSYDGKDLGARKYYNKQHGNYYTNPRQDVNIPFARPPSFLQTVINAIKRLLLIPDRIRRQGFVGALSGLAPVAIAGVATAGVFRNEIADMVEDLANPTTTTTTAATTTTNPCKGVTCATNKVAISSLGICQCLDCSSDSDCTDDTDANRCVSGQCVCGSTGGKCTTTSGKPVCTKSAAFSTAATSSDGASAVCSCKANSCLPNVVTDGTVSICDTSTGTCKCGAAKNAACTAGTTIPACKVTSTGIAPTSEADTANCQCTRATPATDTCSTATTDTSYSAKKPTCSTTDMDTDSKKTAQKAFGVCQVCNICTSKDNKVCSSGWLVGTTKSGASPDKTNLVSTCSAINSNGCCAGGDCVASTGKCS